MYNRPWCFAQFERLARETWPDCQPVSVSEHRSADTWGLSTAFYAAFKKEGEGTDDVPLTESEISDMILRCRLLRLLDRSYASRLLLAMYRAIEQCLDEQRPVAALSISVDSYVIHVLSVACRKRGIPFVGIVPSFVNGYFRVSVLGERTESRRADDEEIRQVTDMLMGREYKPVFLAQTPKAVQRRALRGWLRNLPKPLWFRFRRWLSGDQLNYHYMTTQLWSQRYWSLTPSGYSGERPTSRQDIAGVDALTPLIFLPLQVAPETTIDYWSADVSWIDYEQRVLEIIAEYRGDIVFLVKEHPNAVGMRSPGFYRQLERSSCIMIAPELTSNSVLDLCDGALICTGSVGFEAALRGLPVFSDSRPFHTADSFIRPIAALRDFYKSRDDGFEDPKGRNSAAQRNERIVRHLLEGLLPGQLINDGSWSADDPSHIEANASVARSLRGFLARFEQGD